MTKSEHERLMNEIRRHGHEPAFVRRGDEYRVFVKLSKRHTVLSYVEFFPSSDLKFLRRFKPVHKAVKS